MEADEIRIQGLEVVSTIGVYDSEREAPQKLVINVGLTPARGLSRLGDNVENTIDYDRVAGEVRDLCSRGERNLVETLAEEIAGHLLATHPLARVEVEVRKFVIPDTEYVSVRIARGEGEA